MLHGTEVHDPYRWLEDGDSEETAAWSAAQNARTRAVLDALPSGRPLHHRLLALLQVGVVGSPAVAGDRVFTLEREGDQDQSVLVVRSRGRPRRPGPGRRRPPRPGRRPRGVDRLVLPSPDGRLVAYGVSEGGSEHGTLRIVEVDSGALLADAIPHVRHPSLAWLPDGSAFAYDRLPDPATVARRRGGLLGDGVVAPGGRRPGRRRAPPRRRPGEDGAAGGGHLRRRPVAGPARPATCRPAPT